MILCVGLIALQSASTTSDPSATRPLDSAVPGASTTDGAHPPYSPFIEPRSSEPQLVMKGFKIADGFTIDCFASEPDVAHPVCFTFGQDGACYVAETFRHHTGVADIRDHMSWLDDDVASRSVDDRVAMLHKHLGVDFWKYELAPERIRLLRDTDHDGHVDKATVFADAFHFAPDGIGAGLLEHHGDLFYTCIPDMWRLRDTDGDDRADVLDKMSTGWGIRVSLLGHDMHGIAIGPDGKLYWSIGDRGFRVTNKEGELLDNPLTGAVLRSNLDGSELEIFATGLRNPQELCFDDFGNLWTGDNNSDAGDEARFVQVLEAGETGWRQSFQWLEEPHMRGAWHEERLWMPHFDGQAAYIVPPVANVAHGPSGLCFNPGTGMSDRWNNHFFLCDFEGATEASGVITFTIAPQGASYAVSAPERFVWGPLATDCDFGHDGGLYVSDWVAGWNKTGKGRIWHVTEPDVVKDPLIAKTRELIESCMSKRSVAELGTLLGYIDRRVRQAAHLELASRGAEGAAELRRIAENKTAALLPRLHATWGLEVAFNSDAQANTATLKALLADTYAEVRAQAARVCGDLRLSSSLGPLMSMLRDPSARVRMYAAIGLARIGSDKALDPLLTLIQETGEHDAHLRHAAIYGLWKCATPQRLSTLAIDPSVEVRVAAVVALRRLQSPLIARFLGDASWRVRAEAARAIYDLPIEAAMKDLAAQITRPELTSMDLRVPTDADPNAFQASNGFVRRVLNANFRLGRPDRAAALAKFAADPAASPAARREALDLLAQWPSPPGRDPMSGEWMPLAPRDDAPITDAAVALESTLHVDAPATVLRGWMKLAVQQCVDSSASRLLAIARDTNLDGGVRVQALQALGDIQPYGTAEMLESTLHDDDARVRAASLGALLSVDPKGAMPLLEAALNATIPERRVAYQGMSRVARPEIDAVFVRELNALDAGTVPPAVALDLVTAAERRNADSVQAALTHRNDARQVDPLTARYEDSLCGGDAEKGRDIFRGKTQLECLRCHLAEGEGGIVGPNLHDVSKRLTREVILESIVDPNRRFAPGYQGTVVFPLDGPPVEGSIIEDTPEHIVLRKSDGTSAEVLRSEIDVIKPGLSAMPTNHAEHLSREEMRDLIEYLCTL